MGTVSGRFIPCNGLGPHTGLQIQAVAGGTIRATTFTSENGDFKMDLPAGRYDLMSEHRRLASVDVVSGRTTPFSSVALCG